MLDKKLKENVFSKLFKIWIYFIVFFCIKKKFSRLEAENFLLKCFGSKKPKIRAKTFISDVNLSFLVSLSLAIIHKKFRIILQKLSFQAILCVMAETFIAFVYIC